MDDKMKRLITSEDFIDMVLDFLPWISDSKKVGMRIRMSNAFQDVVLDRKTVNEVINLLRMFSVNFRPDCVTEKDKQEYLDYFMKMASKEN